MQVLLDTKKEYIEHLLDKFSTPISKRIYKIYSETQMNISNFQKELINIKSWNNNKIKDEYNELVKKTKCKYLDKLLEKIVIIDIKLKMDNKIKISAKAIDIIKPYDFIHKCMINISIFCWKNVYLFCTKNLKPSEQQYHLNLIEKNIRKIIKNTLRDIIPYEKILYESKHKKESSSEEEEVEEEENEEEDEDDDDEEDEEDDEEEEIQIEPLKEIKKPVEVIEPLKEIKKPVEVIEPLKEDKRPLEVIEPLKEIKKPIEVIEPLKEETEKKVLIESIEPSEEEEEEEELPIEPLKKEEETTLLSSSEDEDGDDDFIDPTSFKGLSKKKNTKIENDIDSDTDESSSSSSSSEEENDDENIKRINVKTMKRNRYYS